MAMDSTEYIVVLVTCPPDRAESLARSVVEERLVACVNILGGVRSIYTWQGKICDDGEALLVLKTRLPLFEQLRARVATLHPYDIPEIIALPILAGHPPYLQWLSDTTQP
jgi:periplasmic divalent cation tolerance protein